MQAEVEANRCGQNAHIHKCQVFEYEIQSKYGMMMMAVLKIVLIKVAESDLPSQAHSSLTPAQSHKPTFRSLLISNLDE